MHKVNCSKNILYSLLFTTFCSVSTITTALNAQENNLDTIIVQSPDEQNSAITNNNLVIEDGTHAGQFEGFVPKTTLTGSKTDTPIEEIPQSISIFTKERIEAQGFDSISDVFRYTPGVNGESFGNDTRVDFLRFRGFDGGNDASFLDGLSIINSGFGQFMPEIYGMERVEVLKGPSSGLFGQGNPGGIVNLVSKRAYDGFLAEGEAFYGSFNQKGVRFDANATLNEGKTVFGRITGVFREGDSQNDFIDDDRLFIAPTITIKPTKNFDFTILSYLQEDDTGAANQFLPSQGTLRDNPNGNIPINRFLGEPGFDDFKRDVYSIGYSTEYRANENLKFRQNLRYSDLDVEYKTVFGFGLPDTGDLRTLNRGAFTADGQTQGLAVDTNVQYDYKKASFKSKFLLGLDYKNYDLAEQQGFALAPAIDVFNPVYGAIIPEPPLTLNTNIEQEQIGLYSQTQLTIYDSLIITLTGRQDYVDTKTTNLLSNTVSTQDDEAFSGRAGFAYKTKLGITPYFSYAKSFAPEVGTDANGDNFDPTTGEQYEVGIRYKPVGYNALFSIAAFDLTRQNVRTEDPTNINNDIQTGEVVSRGIEVEANGSIDNWKFNFAYAFLDTEITKSNEGDEGNRFGQTPEHEVSAYVSYTFNDTVLKGLQIGLGGRYRSGTTNNANTIDVPGFFVADATLGYTLDKVNFKLEIENLFDNEYVATCSSSNACFYGPDQRITARVGYKW